MVAIGLTKTNSVINEGNHNNRNMNIVKWKANESKKMTKRREKLSKSPMDERNGGKMANSEEASAAVAENQNFM